MAITLIQPQEVVNNGILNAGPISDRFDSALLAAHVRPAELRFLRPILCEEFYNELISTKENEISNYNTDLCPLVEAYPSDALKEKLFREQILPFMSYCILWQAAPFIGVQIGSNGILEMNTGFSQPLGANGAKFVQDSLMSTIEILKGELIKFLCDNKADYPKFCDDCYCKCNCKESDCCECNESRASAPKLGIVFYGKDKHKHDKNNYHKFKDLY